MRMNLVKLSLVFVIAAVAEPYATGLSASAAALQTAANVPSFDIPTICGRVTESVETPQGCVASEESARDQLDKVWTKYASAERSRCTELSSEGGLASYAELLTCLEVSNDAKNLSNE